MILRYSAFFLFLIPLCSYAEEGEFYFDFSPELQVAYRSVLDLRLDQAQEELDILKKTDPDNALVYHVENYIDFFTLFITEDKELFDELIDNKDKRLEKIRKGNSDSPYYRFSQAEIHLQWGLIRAKFEQKLRAFNEVSSAFNLLEENIERHPDFIVNNKSMGVLHALIGTIPDKYKWGVKLISGMEGTIDQGITEIEHVLEETDPDEFFFHEETVVLYAFLMLHLQNAPDNAWGIIQNAELDASQSPLAAFVLSNIAFRSGRNDEAISILERRAQGDEYLDFYYLDYVHGLALLRKLDPEADLFLDLFLENFNGRHYVKEAWQKKSWYNLIHREESDYRESMKECLYSGYTVIDEDKNAMREARSGDIPNASLLKVRLLTDGGYYEKALNALDGIDIGFETEDYLELLYRTGRVHQKLGNTEAAVSQFSYIVENWPEHTSYMVANSALQLGLIHEDGNNIDRARHFFQLALLMKPEQYKTGIQQKAKAGLLRVKT